MNYEVVYLEEKKVVGLSTRTKNSDPNMSAKIGNLWDKFYTEGIYGAIPHKKSMVSIGLYDAYENHIQGNYDMCVSTEVTDVLDIPGNTIIKTIPSGKYAKFIVRGHMQKAVANFWKELWQMDLNGNYLADFEEYVVNDIENCEIHIFIGIY